MSEPMNPTIPLHRMWMAVGRMVFHFAEMEWLVFRYLCELSEASDAKAIFSGDARIAKAKSQISRIHKARGIDLDPESERQFSQIAAISKLRNDLLHIGYCIIPEDNGSYIIDNRRWAIEEPTRYYVSEESVNNAGRDLQVIKEYILFITSKIFESKHTASFPGWKLEDYQRYAWLYKSPQPIRHPSRSHEDQS